MHDNISITHEILKNLEAKALRKIASPLRASRNGPIIPALRLLTIVPFIDILLENFEIENIQATVKQFINKDTNSWNIPLYIHHIVPQPLCNLCREIDGNDHCFFNC